MAVVRIEVTAVRSPGTFAAAQSVRFDMCCECCCCLFIVVTVLVSTTCIRQLIVGFIVQNDGIQKIGVNRGTSMMIKLKSMKI